MECLEIHNSVELVAVGAQRFHLLSADRVGDRLVDIGRGNVVVFCGYGQFGVADLSAGDPKTVVSILGDIASLTADGMRVVLLHGGGPQATALAQRLDIPRGTVMSRLYHARKSFRDRFPQLASSPIANKEET